MFFLEKEFTFEAAHQLPKHDGKCARLHGHSWKGRLIVCGTTIVPDGCKAGMLVDYGDLKGIIQPIVEQYLDHWFLNQTTGLANPTSEELARWLYNKIAPRMPEGVDLYGVQIDETCTARCIYSPRLVMHLAKPE